MIYLLILFLQLNLSPPKSISINGMTVEWSFNDQNQIQFKMTAPAHGWVAIGLNSKNQLVQSNLIMASVSKGQGVISDRYVLEPRNHQAIQNLNGASLVQLLSAQEDQFGTSVKFLLSTRPQDAYHYALHQGNTIYLTIAFAHEDDFSHHSAMRTTLEIIL